MEYNLKKVDPHLSFANFFKEKDSKDDNIFLAAYHISKNLSDGHICLDISKYNNSLYEVKNIDDEKEDKKILDKKIDLKLLKTSKFVTDILQSNNLKRPFILDRERFYLQRYWIYETKIINEIQNKIKNSTKNRDKVFKNLKENSDFILSQFGEIKKEKIEWSLVAVLNSVLNDFSIITGGPGTGKTFTVAKLLAILLKLNPKESIVMTAPTGKAAARMKESLDSAINDKLFGVKADKSIIEKLEIIEAKTLHSLLGYQKGTHRFKRNSNNKLQNSVIIADEASMIDVSMMSKLLDAIKEGAKIVLLGDKDQLASVEAGSIFGDLCRICGDNIEDITKEVSKLYSKITNEDIQNTESQNSHSLFGAVCELKVSRRFIDGEGIGKFSKSVILGDETIIDNDDFFSSTKDVEITESESVINKLFLNYKKYIQEDNIKKALDLFDYFRVLCSTREGKFGVKEVNERVEKILKLNPKKENLYENQPIMIRKNDAQLNIYNGDTGIIRKDTNGKLCFYMRGREDSIPVALISNYETAFAMTIHKSQGSDYDTVAVLMPEDENRVLSKELLYTAITRAKKKVVVLGKKSILKSAISKGVDRISGVVERMEKI